MRMRLAVVLSENFKSMTKIQRPNLKLNPAQIKKASRNRTLLWFESIQHYYQKYASEHFVVYLQYLRVGSHPFKKS